jgi:excisionase family DNA binding protein
MRPERPLEERLTLRVGEVATLLGVPERTVYRWVADGHLPVVRVGRVTLVPRRDLEEWVEREKKRAW